MGGDPRTLERSHGKKTREATRERMRESTKKKEKNKGETQERKRDKKEKELVKKGKTPWNQFERREGSDPRTQFSLREEGGDPSN